MGSGIGGLLNATFGNAAELIIALVALRAGRYDVVPAIFHHIVRDTAAARERQMNWMEGAQLLGVYVILGPAFHFLP